MSLYFLSESDCTDRGSFSGQTHEYLTLVKSQIDSSSDREAQESLRDITNCSLGHTGSQQDFQVKVNFISPTFYEN